MNNLFEFTSDSPRFTLKAFFIKLGGGMFNSDATDLLARMKDEGLIAVVREIRRQGLSTARENLVAAIRKTSRVTVANLSAEQIGEDADTLISIIQPKKNKK